MACAAGLFGLSLLFWPVDGLIVRSYAPDRTVEPPVFVALAPLGQEFGTGFIHSVQRTPVLDVYRIAGGRIWLWREYVQSHNAGLPFQAPAFGRFRLQYPWMVIEGGRQAWPRIVLRVGNAELGRNVFIWKQEDGLCPSRMWRIAGRQDSSMEKGMVRIDLHEHYPGQRFTLGVERQPLACMLAYRADI